MSGDSRGDSDFEDIEDLLAADIQEALYEETKPAKKVVNLEEMLTFAKSIFSNGGMEGLVCMADEACNSLRNKNNMPSKPLSDSGMKVESLFTSLQECMKLLPKTSEPDTRNPLLSGPNFYRLISERLAQENIEADFSTKEEDQPSSSIEAKMEEYNEFKRTNIQDSIAGSEKAKMKIPMLTTDVMLMFDQMSKMIGVSTAELILMGKQVTDELGKEEMFDKLD
jgi:hypothetical protein